MTPIVVTVGPLTSGSANAIALSQTPSGAGPFTLNGALVTSGVANLKTPRQVLITTTSGAESTKTFTITGTDWAGSPISEVVQGPSGTTAASVLSYLTVTSVVISAAAADPITIGTNGVGASPWVRLDGWANPAVSIQCTATGTVNYTVQQTMDDPNSPTSPVNPHAVTWVSSPVAALVAATGTEFGTLTSQPVFMRTLLNSGTGSVMMTVQQSGAVPY